MSGSITRDEGGALAPALHDVASHEVHERGEVGDQGQPERRVFAYLVLLAQALNPGRPVAELGVWLHEVDVRWRVRANFSTAPVGDVPALCAFCDSRGAPTLAAWPDGLFVVSDDPCDPAEPSLLRALEAALAEVGVTPPPTSMGSELGALEQLKARVGKGAP